MNDKNLNTKIEGEYLSGTSLSKSLFKENSKHLVCMVSNLSDDEAIESQNINLIIGYEETENSFIFLANDGSKWSCAVPVSSKNNQPLYLKTNG